MKRIRLTLYLLFLLLNLSYRASTQDARFMSIVGEEVTRLVPAKLGHFYTLSFRPSCPDDHLAIRYMSPQGQVLMTTYSPVFPGNITSYDAVVNKANELVIYMRINDINHSIYAIDAAGNTLWNNHLQFTTPKIRYTKINLADNGYYLSGSTDKWALNDTTQGILSRLDATGKLIWTKNYRLQVPFVASTGFNDLLVEQNRLVVVGYYYPLSGVGGQIPYRPLLTILDTAGTFQSAKLYTIDSGMVGFDEYEWVKIRRTPKGAYYTLGYNFGNEHAIFRLDELFQIKWIRYQSSGIARDICPGFDEDIWIAPDYHSQNFVLSLDSNGQIAAKHVTKHVPGTMIDYGRVTRIQRDSCGFLVCNDEDMVAHTDPSFNYCLDSLGVFMGGYSPENQHVRHAVSLQQGLLTSYNEYVLPSVFSAITSIPNVVCQSNYTCSVQPNTVASYKDFQASVYPVPATSSLFIEYDGQIEEIFLIDMSGRKYNLDYEESGPRIKVNLHNFCSGNYMLQVRSAVTSQVLKIIIEK